MERTLNRLMLGFVIVTLLMLTYTVKASATELQDGKATFYLPTGNKTATGTVPTQHITVASDKEHLGKTVAIYIETETGLIFVGYFQCEDTGGKVHDNHFDIYVDSLDTDYEPFRYLIDDVNRDGRKIKYFLTEAVG